MRKFTSADYRVMPWNNGGGTTTELYMEPGGDGSFRWRVSIATVSADGPFSLFTGYDRHIMAIEGHGMVLEGGPHGPIDVSQKFSPRCFSGDWPIIAHLVSGPVRDFNLMARRNNLMSSLACFDVRASLQLGGQAGATIFAHVLAHDLMVNGDVMLEGESMLLLPGEHVSVTPPHPHSVPRLAVCRINPCAGQ